MDRLRRGLATVVLAGTALAAAGVPPIAYASDPPTSTTYEVRPEARLVAVTVETTTGSVEVPTAATALVATLNGEPLDVPTGGPITITAPGGAVLEVSFDLADDPTGSGVRVNPAYAWFPTMVWGPSGSAVRIRVPNDFAIKVDGAVLITDQQPGWTVMSAPRVTDPAAWSVTVSARRDAALDTHIARAGGITYVLRSWPGDDAWVDAVAGVLDDALPRLAGLIGIADPIGRPLIIAQSTDPSRSGFDGWYIAATDTIEVGPDPDPHVLVHEVSHAWFNDDLVDERWLAEGLAETYAALAGHGSGGVATAPPPGLVLADWGHTALVDGSTIGAERAAYAASWWVVQAIVDDVGLEGMRNVIADLARARSAYADPGFVTTDAPADWRRFLDLAERHGASPAVEALIADHVAPTRAVPELDTRRRAITRYTALADDPLGWRPPVGVRSAMDGWDFTTAETRMDAAFAALAARDRLATEGARVEAFRVAYEAAETPSIPVAEPTPLVEPSPAPDAMPVLPVAPIVWVAAMLGAAILVAGTLRRRPAPRPAPSGVAGRSPSPVGGQLELFPLAILVDADGFTLIDLDVLHRLDEELAGVEQQVLFELPPTSTRSPVAADPWADMVRSSGVARL